MNRKKSLKGDSQSQWIYCVFHPEVTSILPVCVLLLEPGAGVHLGAWIWSLPSTPRTIVLPPAACWHRLYTSLTQGSLAPHPEPIEGDVKKSMKLPRNGDLLGWVD